MGKLKEEATQTLEPLIIKKRSNLAQYRPDSTVYFQKDRIYEEQGTPIEGDKYNPTQNLIGAMQNVTPHYDTDRNQWSFYGDVEDLKRIAKKLSLSDDKTKQVITVDEDDLVNKYSKFWAHPILWKSLFIEDNARYLEADTPLNELFNRVLRGREDVSQPGRTDQSTFETDRSNLELISPQIEKDKRKANTGEITEAMKLYIDLLKDEDRLKLVALILDPMDYEEASKDVTSLASLLQTDFVNNDERVGKYNTTARKYFITIASLSNEDLSTYSIAIRAKKSGVVRQNTTDGYTFKGEKLNNGLIKSDSALCEFLKDPNNTNIFLAIEEALSITNYK